MESEQLLKQTLAACDFNGDENNEAVDYENKVQVAVDDEGLA